MKLRIQIPCYNEESTLGVTVADLPRHIDGIDVIAHPIINDGSTDRTVAIARELGMQHIVSFPCNKGSARGFMAELDACLRHGSWYPLLGATIMAICLGFFVVIAVWGRGTGYDGRIIVSVCVIAAVWTALLFLCRTPVSPKDALLAAAIFLVLGVSQAKEVWCIGYLSLSPYESISQQQMHLDPLYHATLTESIITNGYPSLLINGGAYYAYHCLYHYLMAGVSLLTGIPAFLCITYLGAVFLLPLYVFASLRAIEALRLVLAARADSAAPQGLTLLDIALFLVFVVGFPSDATLTKLSTLKYWATSESFLLSLILLASFLILSGRMFAHGGFQRKEQTSLYLFAIVPLFIFLTSAAKISVGMLLAAGVGYYCLRRAPGSIGRNALLFAEYAAVFSGCYLLFSANPVAGQELQAIVPFAFLRDYVQPSLWISYFCYVGFFVVASIALSVWRERSFAEIVRSRSQLYMETLLVVFILGLLPGLLFRIDGKSAAYFSRPAEYLAFLAFMGLDGANRCLRRLTPLLKRAMPRLLCLSAAAIVLLVVSGNTYHVAECWTPAQTRTALFLVKERYALHRQSSAAPASTLSEKLTMYFSPTAKTPLLCVLDDIKDIVGHADKRDYCIYLAPDAEGWSMPNRKTTVFLYTGLTGVSLVGPLYEARDEIYYMDGTLCDATSEPLAAVGYAVTPRQYTLADAKAWARENGRKYVVYVHGQTAESLRVND